MFKCILVHISMFKCILVSLLETKSFVSLKNESSLFWTSVHFKEGTQVLQHFEGGLLMRGGGVSDRFKIFLGGLRKKG